MGRDGPQDCATHSNHEEPHHGTNAMESDRVSDALYNQFALTTFTLDEDGACMSWSYEEYGKEQAISIH